MSTPGTNPENAPHNGAEQRKVAIATVIGTTVEWYDYFIYAAAAGLVFDKLFFAGFGPEFASIVSFFTVGISFLFRPLGAFLSGHFGDRFGRRIILVVTLLGMGGATTLIGVLPDSDAIGVLAPILLILLRVVQGISAGGEWGGAVLMAVEHAPTKRRGLFGAMPQIGVPLGLLLSSGMLALMDILFPGDSFDTWGWRIPFLFSAVLIAVGYWVRRSVEESPIFHEIAEKKAQSTAPVAVLFKRFTPLVIFAALVFAGNNAVGYMTTGGYIQGYASDPDGPVALDRGPVLWAVTISGVSWLIFAFLAGWICDYIGRRNTYIAGWILQAAGVLALFPLVNAGHIGLLILALIFLTVGLGLTYGPQPAWYAELFPSSVRFSGVAISYAIGAVLGGAFAPFIAESLYKATGGTVAITIYLLGMTLIGLIGTVLLRDRKGIDLSVDAEAEQERGIYTL